jgi:hypothetical protein
VSFGNQRIFNFIAGINEREEYIYKESEFCALSLARLENVRQGLSRAL